MYPRSPGAPSFFPTNSNSALLYTSFASGFMLSKLTFRRTSASGEIALKERKETHDVQEERRIKRPVPCHVLLVLIDDHDVLNRLL